MAWGGYILAVAVLAFSTEVQVEGPAVRLGDVADVSALPADLAARAGALHIASLRPGQAQTFTAEAVARRARALLPALGPWLAPQSDQTILVRRAAGEPARGEPERCMRIVEAAPAGSLLSAGDMEPAACEGAVAAGALRYDPARRAVRAERAISAGDRVPAPPSFALPTLRPGEVAHVRVRIGPVVVERPVEALQAARPGQRLFVRTPEGDVFAARLEEAAP